MILWAVETAHYVFSLMRMQCLNQSNKVCIAVIYCTGVSAGLRYPFQNFARCA